MNGIFFKIIYNNHEYNMIELKEIFYYLFFTLLINYKSYVVKLIKLIVKLLKIPNYYPYLCFILKLIFIRTLTIIIKNMPKFNYVRTKFNLYKHYLNHQMMDVDDYNYDSDGDFKMSSPKKLRKSILKRTKKGTITEILSYKRVIFSDNQVVIYYLSDDEKKMKLKAYQDIKRRNNC